MKVYLAGQISGLTYGDAQNWRQYAAEELGRFGIQGFSPLRAKDFLDGEGILEGSYEYNPLSTAKGILTRDRYDVMTSDMVIANLLDVEKPSIGTVMEIAYADAYRKPLVLVMEEGNVHEHPMIDQAAGYIVRTLDDGLNIIKSILLPQVVTASNVLPLFT